MYNEIVGKPSLLETEQRMAHFIIISLCFITWFLKAISTSLPALSGAPSKWKPQGDPSLFSLGVTAVSLSCLCTHPLLEAPRCLPADSHQSAGGGEPRRPGWGPSSGMRHPHDRQTPTLWSCCPFSPPQVNSTLFSHFHNWNPFKLMRTAGGTVLTTAHDSCVGSSSLLKKIWAVIIIWNELFFSTFCFKLV